ncbi:MAG TPA: phosphopantetheine-binding protein [Bacteroidia bacterium]|nr:phosphopantetheine-binding protein [Bacteroidia bacterium]
MEKEIREFIIDFFKEKEKVAGIDHSALVELNFVEARILDSIEFITLIAEVEERFGLVFTESDIQSPGFSTIKGMVDITSSRINVL